MKPVSPRQSMDAISKLGSNSLSAAPTTGQKQKFQETNIGEQLNRMAGRANGDEVKAKKPGEMGKDDFLKLMMTQLKYQDPLNPLKNEDFGQQMAMFSNLEQTVNINKNLEKMMAAQGNKSFEALNFVGKNIEADKGVLFHDKSRPSHVSFQLPQDSNQTKVVIENELGEVVKELPLGPQTQGSVSIKWDGTNELGSVLDSGKYSFKVQAQSESGEAIDVPSKISGRVTGVTTRNGQVTLMVGDQQVALGDVQMIKEATEPSNSILGANAPAGTKLEAKNSKSSDAGTFGTQPARGNVKGEDRDSTQISVDEAVEAALRGEDGADTEEKFKRRRLERPISDLPNFPL